jgi:hypothetical protein
MPCTHATRHSMRAANVRAMPLPAGAPGRPGASALARPLPSYPGRQQQVGSRLQGSAGKVPWWSGGPCHRMCPVFSSPCCGACASHPWLPPSPQPGQHVRTAACVLGPAERDHGRMLARCAACTRPCLPPYPTHTRHTRHPTASAACAPRHRPHAPTRAHPLTQPGAPTRW